jgi:PQQ-dependent catabolism-associated CXXCW motif protein
MKLRDPARLPFRRHACTAALLLALNLPALAQQDFGQAPPPGNTGGYTANPGVGQPGGYPPGSNTGFPQQPGMNPGMQQPGMNPGMSPGMQPGMNPGMQPGMQPGMNSGAQPGTNPAQLQAAQAMQALLRYETQDYGVPPQQQLQASLHGPTPTRIPGGQVITTDRLLTLYQQGAQNGLLVFHVLGPGPTLPYAQNAAPASQPGSFDDQTQQQFGQYLQQVTQGNKSRPLVFYCQSTQCWMSYNASLRAIRLGFSQVYWYRGGIEAWQQAQQLAAGFQPGQPMQPTGYPGGNPRQGY